MRERPVSQTLPVRFMMNSAHNPNRSLIRIFCLSLSGLLAVYATIAVSRPAPVRKPHCGGTGERRAPDCAGAGRGRRPAPLGLGRPVAAAPGRTDGRRLRSRLRGLGYEDEDQVDRSGDDAQPAAGTRADPLARIDVSGLFVLQEFHDAGLLPRARRGLRGGGTAALRPRDRAADAGAVCRGRYAVCVTIPVRPT